MVARCDGRSDTGISPHSCRHHGDGRHFSGGALLAAVRVVIDGLAVVTVVGAVTAFFAATVGLVQNDIKRVIAYSTCSQLGYMFVALGVGAYQAAMFHLFTHAFFKALLFLGAGSVIHAMQDEQDMRKMGGLRTLVPASWFVMIIGTLALTGFPLTAGFFSKDAIVEAAYAAQIGPHMFAFSLLVVALCLPRFTAGG